MEKYFYLAVAAAIVFAFLYLRQKKKESSKSAEAKSPLPVNKAQPEHTDLQEPICEAATETCEPPVPEIDSAFAYSQLIGQSRFMQAYREQLTALYASTEFREFIAKLRLQLNGLELCDTHSANMLIADVFYHSDINGKYPDARKIVEGVKKYGRQASAHISIYYAMFILDDELNR